MFFQIQNKLERGVVIQLFCLYKFQRESFRTLFRLTRVHGHLKLFWQLILTKHIINEPTENIMFELFFVFFKSFYICEQVKSQH